MPYLAIIIACSALKSAFLWIVPRFATPYASSRGRLGFRGGRLPFLVSLNLFDVLLWVWSMSSFLGNLCGVFGFNRYFYSSCESAGSSSLTLNSAFSTASLLREQINLVHSLVQWILNRWKIAGYCVMTNARYKFLDFFAWFSVHVTQKLVTFTQNKTLWVK